MALYLKWMLPCSILCFSIQILLAILWDSQKRMNKQKKDKAYISIKIENKCTWKCKHTHTHTYHGENHMMLNLCYILLNFWKLPFTEGLHLTAYLHAHLPLRRAENMSLLFPLLWQALGIPYLRHSKEGINPVLLARECL